MPFQKVISLALLLLALLFALPLMGQEEAEKIDSTIIEIVSTQSLKGIDTLGLKILSGNVVLIQGNSTFHCDSAYLYEGRNDMKAYGNVLIEQGDSVEIEANFLDYNGTTRKATLVDKVLLTDNVTIITADSMDYWMDTKRALIKSEVFITDQKVEVWADSVDYYSQQKKAYLTGNTKLTDGGMEIIADEMDYDFNSENGYYRGNGNVTNKNTILKSEDGFYDAKTKDVRFTNSVSVDDPEYQLDTDTLLYNTTTELATFNGESRIVNQGNIINSKGGSYDKASNRIVLDKSPVLSNPPQSLSADSLYFDKTTGIGYATGNVFWTDSSEEVTITGKYMEYFEETQYVLSTDSVLMQQIIDGDTLFLSADTIVSMRGDSAKYFRAYQNVRVFKSDFQAVCDSLNYNFADSSFHFFQDPILWSDNSQLTGDTILLTTHNSKPKNIYLYPNGVVGQMGYPQIYDQLRGDTIVGSFVESELVKIDVKGAAESIYYAQNERDQYYGINESKGNRMVILLENREVQMIKMYEDPMATFHPIKKVDPLGFKVKGFRWRVNERPLTSNELRTPWKRPSGRAVPVEPGATSEEPVEAPTTPKPPVDRPSGELEPSTKDATERKGTKDPSQRGGSKEP